MKILEHAPLAPLASVRTGGTARYYAEIGSEDDLVEAFEFSVRAGVRFHVAGEGTNSIFKDGPLDILIAAMKIKGFEFVDENGEGASVRASSGENWDAVVSRLVGKGLCGLEALSGVPGSVGAAPVQNIGAYGQEVANAVVEVRAYDTETGGFVTIPARSCGFGYRKSVFNSAQKGRFAIVSALFRLSRRLPGIPDYPGLRGYFAERGIAAPDVLQTREAVLALRSQKLPDPRVVPNAGSFFKNPVIPRAAFEPLAARFPEVPSFPAEAGIKVPAGWLIERAGLKGARFGRVAVYEKNALVLTNLGSATTSDIMAARDAIRARVGDVFGIDLEQEPETIG